MQALIVNKLASSLIVKIFRNKEFSKISKCLFMQNYAVFVKVIFFYKNEIIEIVQIEKKLTIHGMMRSRF